MPHLFRRAFPYLALGLLGVALVWATSFGTLPPADFAFQNGNELETIDPALATGQPEHRVLNALFEGLLRNEPPDDWQALDGPGKNVPITPRPAAAEDFSVSDDGLTYTFQMRKDAKWTDGSPVTADDFAWSWRRTLHPETGARYGYQLYYIAGAQHYNLAQVDPGDRVEVELPDRRDPLQPFPRGTILRGVLRSLHKPPQPVLPPTATDKQTSDAEVAWKKKWVYVVEVKPQREGQVDWEAAGRERRFAKEPGAVDVTTLTPALSQRERGQADRQIERCLHVLPDFESTVGVRAEGPGKLVVTLHSRTPFFADLLAFYPTFPVNRRCIETFGSPNWTKPENIVGNGPFRMQFRRIRDRIRMVKSETYWDKGRVRLTSVDALAMKSETTALNMYLDGQLDWVPYLPVHTIPDLRQDYADQFRSAPMLTTYFYRVNVTRPELADKRVRQALNLAIDKQAICERVTRAGEVPAATYVPPGLTGYVSPAGSPHDVPRAQALLAEAGYPGGRGLPTIEILYNDLDRHKTIAEAIQQFWRESLKIHVELRGLEWGVYLDSTHKLDYDVARAGWIADYPDPNTFLDMFVTGNENNQTGWSHSRYDELIRQAAQEADSPRRMALFQEAEAILLEEAPILPIYFYVSTNLVSPRVQGFFNNVQDDHPLWMLSVEDE